VSHPSQSHREGWDLNTSHNIVALAFAVAVILSGAKDPEAIHPPPTVRTFSPDTHPKGELIQPTKLDKPTPPQGAKLKQQ
jgi:hypothetical protein